MKNNRYSSRIDKPVVRSTSAGGRFVTPFDIIRSTNGRAVIKSHAAMAKSENERKGAVESGKEKTSVKDK